jgi:hypothetical protein
MRALSRDEARRAMKAVALGTALGALLALLARKRAT